MEIQEPGKEAVQKSGKGELSFQPLTEGLGFQPFSDGLPYAPIQKSSAQSANPQGRIPSPFMGSGAVSAGPPTLAKTLPVIGPSHKTSSPHATEAKPSLAAAAPKEELRPTGLYIFQRIMAYTLDVCLAGILFLGAVSAMVSYHLISADQLMNEDALWVAGAVFFILNWVLITFQEVILLSTLGKRMFRLGLSGSRFRIFWRAILFVPCSLIFGLGLIWSLLNARKACLHDRLSGIQPIDL